MTDLFEENPDQGIADVKIEDLVGEGKKFKTVEDAIRGKLEADRFIEQLKSELGGLREELNTRIKLEEFMDQFKNTSPQQSQPSGDNQDRRGGDDTALSPDTIRKLLDEELQKREQVNTAKQNLSSVKQKLAETFGSNYATRLDAEAKKLGVSRDFLNNMAATSPNAFLRLVGVDTTVTRTDGDIFTPPTSQNTGSTQSSGTSRNQTYYNKLKAQDPKAYWSPAVQNEMHREAMRQGEAFFT